MYAYRIKNQPCPKFWQKQGILINRLPTKRKAEMNTEFMMVNPNELVIDMPVDEANVRQKMESLQANGVIQPVTVWLQGMRIIDGFHRTVAAVRLGWSVIPCNVIDCTEDAFWDARIQSAKQHHVISKERLAAWITESWKLTEWYAPVSTEEIRDVYKGFGLTVNDNISESAITGFSTAKAVWDMPSFSSDNNLTPEQEWLADKASKWGVSRIEIVSLLIGALGYGESHPMGIVSRLKKEKDISFTERSAIVSSAPFIDSGYSYANPRGLETEQTKEIVVQLIEDVRSGAIVPQAMQYIQAKRLEIQDKERQLERDRIAREQAAENERRRLHAKSPAGQAEAAKLRIDAIREEIEVMGYRLDKIDNYLAKTPEAATMLTEFVLLIESKVKAAFPEYALKSQTNPLLAANAELRRKVREQDERIASLERALKSKGNVSRNVVAMASEELERIN